MDVMKVYQETEVRGDIVTVRTVEVLSSGIHLVIDERTTKIGPRPTSTWLTGTTEREQ
jgi:hypothetical protein